MKKIPFLFALVLLLSCQKNEVVQNLTFNSCDLASTETVIAVADKSATLTYTKDYRNFALPEYTYVIMLPDTTALMYATCRQL